MHAFSNNDDNYYWFCELTVAQIYGTPVRAVHPVLLPTRGQGTDDDSQFISVINKLMPQKCTVIDQLWVCACDIYLWHWRVLCKSILGDQFVTCFCMDLNGFLHGIPVKISTIVEALLYSKYSCRKFGLGSYTGSCWWQSNFELIPVITWKSG